MKSQRFYYKIISFFLLFRGKAAIFGPETKVSTNDTKKAKTRIFLAISIIFCDKTYKHTYLRPNKLIFLDLKEYFDIVMILEIFLLVRYKQCLLLVENIRQTKNWCTDNYSLVDLFLLPILLNIPPPLIFLRLI